MKEDNHLLTLTKCADQRLSEDPDKEIQNALLINRNEEQAIWALLHSLGITENYVGSSQLVYAVRLAQEKPERLASVTKELYPEVAKAFHTSWQCVERNIRTVIELAWNLDAGRVLELEEFPLSKRPRPTQFISLLLNQLNKMEAAYTL